MKQIRKYIKEFKWRGYPFLVGLFLVYLIYLLEWASGMEANPKWVINTLPIWFGFMLNLFDNSKFLTKHT